MGEFPIGASQGSALVMPQDDALREHYEEQNEGAFWVMMGQNHVALRGQKYCILGLMGGWRHYSEEKPNLTCIESHLGAFRFGQFCRVIY